MRWIFLFILLAGPAMADPECYCTDRTGARVELGQVICLQVDGRAFMARCEMSQNVPMWRQTGEDCVVSFLGRLQRFEPARDLGSVDAHVALAEHQM